MTAISLTDLAKTVEQGNPHHHPHLLKVTKNEYNRVVFEFKAFTGTEAEPERPRAMWTDDMPEAARDLLRDEYETAYNLWNDAHYVRTLKTVVAEYSASAKWAAYAEARTAMTVAFTALNTTPDNEWNAAVSRLATAQEAAREAADTWDRAARQIAAVHHDHSGSYLSWNEAYKRAGIDATSWDVQDHYAYTSRYSTDTPLAEKLQDAINEQRDHLRTVSSLTSPVRP
ncbi:hypothetical protein N4G70_29010 [Streptomyces sp. ASQP_92]|uniref:hypothetical protein n=1 Tax=Streptomyces sp. ASQP_92 TaxID=2979116 RepID=UPI0021C15EC7|nr:hypothetical protein [Streptomyces sp. ASQP_92]MCT9092881.1 hypothetical protein [Streptomyces sp. ASQP_92]